MSDPLIGAWPMKDDQVAVVTNDGSLWMWTNTIRQYRFIMNDSVRFVKPLLDGGLACFLCDGINYSILFLNAEMEVRCEFITSPFHCNLKHAVHEYNDRIYFIDAHFRVRCLNMLTGSEFFLSQCRYFHFVGHKERLIMECNSIKIMNLETRMIEQTISKTPMGLFQLQYANDNVIVWTERSKLLLFDMQTLLTKAVYFTEKVAAAKEFNDSCLVFTTSFVHKYDMTKKELVDMVRLPQRASHLVCTRQGTLAMSATAADIHMIDHGSRTPKMIRKKKIKK